MSYNTSDRKRAGKAETLRRKQVRQAKYAATPAK